MVKIGLENLRDHHSDTFKKMDALDGKRLGLLANPASVDRHFTHAKSIIQDLYPGQLTALFSPQHGFHAEKQDNMIESDHGRDPELGIPIFSLYSATRIPTPEMFHSIDTLLIDIQDVGTRVYTFIYTISYCLEMAARLGKKVVILDRPNPVGGRQVEGNCLEMDQASFVGRFPIPMRHGLTVGEISKFFNQRFQLGCDLTLVPMEGWKRDMYWQETGLPWIPPSPNLPTPLSAMVYPGQVIFEGTNVSEGRGTTLPFEQFGAPFMDPPALSHWLEGKIQGAHLRQVQFEPTSGKWANQVCRGFHIHVTDPKRFNSYESSLLFMQGIMALHPEDFEFKQPPYEYEYHKLPMDLILGSKGLRQKIQAQESMEKLSREWMTDLDAFKTETKGYHLYD